MYKPPLIIPNRKGTDLWPTTSQLPAVTRVLFDGQGVDANAARIAQKLSREKLDTYLGALKQFFLRQKMASNLSGLNFISSALEVAPGMSARYTMCTNTDLMDVKVSALGILDALKREGFFNKPTTDVFVVIVYQWTGSNGRDLDTLTRFSQPLRSEYMGYLSLIHQLRAGQSPFGVSTLRGYDVSYDGKLAAQWSSSDVQEFNGSEYLYMDCEPLFRDGYSSVDIELNANWFGERLDGQITVYVDVFRKLGRTYTPYSSTNQSVTHAEIEKYYKAKGAQKLVAVEINTSIRQLTEVLDYVQRVCTITLEPAPIYFDPDGVPLPGQVPVTLTVTNESQAVNPYVV